MKNKLLSVIGIMAIVIVAGCKKDNFKAPESTLSGRVVYQGQPVGVRTDGVQLELWQSGYQLFTKIPVYVAQDGTFSASLFDGDYKLTRIRGNGPWTDNTDTITVQVRGATMIDVPVQPYFVISNPAAQKAGTSVTASCKVDQVATTRAIERVSLYVGTTQFLDAVRNNGAVDLTGTAVSDLTKTLNFSFALPAALSGRDYVFARIGVKTAGVAELLYTNVQKVQLK